MKFGLKEIVLSAGILFGATKASGQIWNVYENNLATFYEDLNNSCQNNKINIIDSSRVKSRSYNYIVLVDSKEVYRIQDNLIPNSFKIEDTDADGDKDIVFTKDVSPKFTKKGERNKNADYNSNISFIKEPEYETVILKNDGDGNFSE